MAPQRIVFQTLKRIGYPVFLPKLETVEGEEHLPTSGGYLIAANHVDWLDGFYIAAAVGRARNVPVNFLTASNNYWWTTMAVQIPPDRRGDIVGVATEALRDGRVICNFIEGQRNNSPKLLPGKTGTVRMAAAAGVPIIPLGITCSAGETMAQSLRFLMSKNHSVSIRIGPSIRLDTPAEGLTKDSIDYATRRVMEVIARLSGKEH